MKKKLIMTLMLSTVILTAGAPLATVVADSTEQKIAEHDSKISAVKDEAAKAQSQVDAVEAQVGTLKEKQVSMEKEVEKLLSQQKQQSEQIQELNKNIKERHEGLEAQARSAQTEGSATNYISAVLDSKSLTNAIQKITAMATVADANKAMIEEQEKDQKNIQEKLKDNQAKYEKVTKLQQDLSSQADELATQEAKLKVAQLSYQATVTSEEGKKQELLSQKAEAERAAQAAAEAQKLAEQQLLLSQQEKPKEETVENTPEPVVPPVTGGDKVDPPIVNPGPTPPPTNNQNPYPWGQCTWGVWEYFGGSIPTYAGNAGDWVVYANSGPAVGTIAVFPPGNQGAGGVGHVAVVTAVNGSTLTISETNFSGPNGGGLGIRTTREVSSAGVSFIRP